MRLIKPNMVHDRLDTKMKIIGITGGVGAGKSQILAYLKEKYGAYILLADLAANELKTPGQVCYEQVIACLGKEILADDGTIDNGKMAAAIFGNQEKLAQINAIIHPAVRAYILEQIKQQREQDTKYFVLEAALLIEEHYDEVVDEMWYIYTSDHVRRERLKVSRGYSDEKITAIMGKQMSDEAFRAGSDFVIDNSGDFEETKKQIDRKMGEV